MPASDDGTPVFDHRLSLARAGDQHALGALVDAYREYLCRIARARMGGALQGVMTTSDLVQETLLDACRDFERFRGTSERELLSWLRRALLRNLADQVRRHRAEKRDRLRNRSLDELLERTGSRNYARLAAALSSPSGQASRREDIVALQNALEALSAEHREVILLRHMERLEFHAIAARMHRSEGAVRKLWARALLRLKALVEAKNR